LKKGRRVSCDVSLGGESASEEAGLFTYQKSVVNSIKQVMVLTILQQVLSIALSLNTSHPGSSLPSFNF
jgi:hypothetical protein